MYWYDGQSIESQQINLDINAPGLLYGATVFTTLRVYDREIDSPLTAYPLHCQRLEISIDRFGWCQPDWERVRSGVLTLASHFPVLRITIFPDGRELITGRELPPQLEIWQKQGVTVTIADRVYTRSLPQHKTGNYLAPWLSLQSARDRGFQEAILTNDRGDWLETTTGNLWGYREGCWYTPPLSAGILPGIARSQIIDHLHHHHRPVVEIEWKADWVKDLSAIGYSNSVVGFIPIHTVITSVGKLEYECQERLTMAH
jgi:4-amino-4-deoxychorismate lyase